MLVNLSKILNVKGGGFNGTSWYNQKEKEEKEEEKEMICSKDEPIKKKMRRIQTDIMGEKS